MSFELEKYEIDVQALMRGLVHELRNPLSAILTASSLLHSGDSIDEESQMLLDVVQKESRRMNRILTEFSHFVKPSAPRVESFDVALLAREVLAELKRDNILSEGIIISDKLPASLLAQGDPQHVGKAFRHILQNSAEALERGGEIALSGDAKGGNVYLEFSDSGQGLPGEASQRAFQPFFSTKPAATGLGLSIARMALRASGGDATIENCANRAHGACVYILLPAAVPEANIDDGAEAHDDDVVPAREALKTSA